MAWLVRDGEVLASVEIAKGRRQRMRGLIGRDGIDGGIVLRPCRQVHTVGVHFPIDVAFCDRDGRVLRVVTVPPWRLTRLVWRSGFVVEAAAGAFERWRLRPGDQVEVKE
jgi:uncharacterized membrane protein (UPF0127 family)